LTTTENVASIRPIIEEKVQNSTCNSRDNRQGQPDRPQHRAVRTQPPMAD
jgi:hypothetical protein